MSYEGGNLNASLVAAVGDDPALLHDLRRAFLESADRQIDLLSRATDDSSWHLALWRLKGLCGSFGVVHMIALVDEAEHTAPGDAKMLRRLRSALTVLSVD
ncbi:MAG: Hpt domain-containing protein [Sphingobium sp.]|nr:Hpt domain-containing protein [Sphingobium sp.]MCP5397762.1 Hpt domain-containing protein [Sphingomonas sp.]